MKNLCRALAIILICALATPFFAQNSNDTYYTIKIGTFNDPIISEFSELSKIGHVYGEQISSDKYDIYLGGFGNILEAQKVVDQVKKLNYPNTGVVPKLAAKGRYVSVVQLALYHKSDKIDWPTYIAAGKLYTIAEDDKVRLITGMYSDYESASLRTDKLHKNGFPKAYVIEVNSIKLHQVSDFDMDVYDIDEQPFEIANEAMTMEKDILVSKGAKPAKPAKVETEAAPSAKLIPRSEPPYVDPNIKRQSVQLLQRILNKVKAFAYENSGIYTKETDLAYNEQLDKNFKVKKARASLKAEKDKINGFYLDWNDIKLLKSIASDISTIEIKYDETELKDLIWFYKKPSVLNPEAEEKVENWDYRLRKGLSKLETEDAVYFESINAFNLTYFKSQILLEDFFMDKGFTLSQSRSLALGTLNTVLNGSMDKYL